MTESIIPNSIKEIIDEFKSLGFSPYTYKKLAYRLDVEPNTLVQRINRNLEYFDITGDRPKIITLRKDLDEIYFYRDKNTCQICQQKKSSNELLTRPKDPYLEKKTKLNYLHDWDNIITCCQDCKNISLIKRLSYKKKPDYISSDNYLWEYKEIEIREIYKLVAKNLEDATSLIDKKDKAKIKAVFEREEKVDETVKQARDSHLVRFYEGTCLATAGPIFNDMLVNFERISDHCVNIAEDAEKLD